MRFSIGDLVTERKSNYWYFHSYGFGRHLTYDSIYEYWNAYDEEEERRSIPIIGIVMSIESNEANDYYTESYYTYRVWWINCPPDESYLMQRYFYEDELRLLSKINTSTVEQK